MTAAVDEQYEQAILDALTAGLHARIAGHRPETLGPAQQVAQRMLATVPAQHPWDEQIGPFYDTSGVVRLLNASKQAVADRVRRRTLLAASTARGRVVYPVWQFDGGLVNPVISRLVTCFRGVPVDGWAIASWFTTPAAALDGATPVEWVLAGGDPDVAQALAQDAAARWAR